MTDSSLAMDVIARLPQAAVIPPERRRAWLDTVLAVEPDRLVWHAQRLRGIGSSEIGTLILGARGEYNAFSDPRDVVMSKLMMAAPDGGSGHTRRGTALEPLIREMFLAQYRAKPRPDVVQAMSASHDPKLPWQVGNPDEICEIGGRRWVVDYKSPTPDTLEECRRVGGIKFDYVAQLHHLAMIARRVGYIPDGLLLCSLDLMGWELDVREVPFDASLIKEIREVGDFYWHDHVMQGVLPPLSIKPTFSLEGVDPGLRQQMSSLAMELAACKQLGRLSLDRADATEARLKEITGVWKLGEHRLRLPGVTVSARPFLVDEEVVKLARNAGMLDVVGMQELERAEAAQRDAAIAELFERLREAGEDVGRCVAENHVTSLSRSKSGPDFEMLQRERGILPGVIDAYVKSASERGVPPPPAPDPIAGADSSATPGKRRRKP